MVTVSNDRVHGRVDAYGCLCRRHGSQLVLMAVLLFRIQSFSWLAEWVGKNLNQRILTLGFSRRTKTCGLVDSALYSTACFVCHERRPHQRARSDAPTSVDVLHQLSASHSSDGKQWIQSTFSLTLAHTITVWCTGSIPLVSNINTLFRHIHTRFSFTSVQSLSCLSLPTRS